MTDIKTIGLARLALKQQVEFFGGDQVSLDSLWRAVGEPGRPRPPDLVGAGGPAALRIRRLSRQPRRRTELDRRRRRGCCGSGRMNRKTPGAPAT